MKIKLSEEEYVQHTNDDDGVCLACGEWTCGGVEPDAENYPCDSCEENQVVGAEQALIMDRIEIT